ncbi:hypothetical protein OAC78_06525 [Litorivicinus sp.]|nr:hypothetical protein [Litorivicinus sp.]MDC1466203.1 hypothetical protein [Litorivicinus sp.]
MTFKKGNTTFGFAMRVPDADVGAVDDLLAAHAKWMDGTHSLTAESGKLQTLEYFVSKATELVDMMDASKGSTGHMIYSVSEVHLDDEHFSKHVELAQTWERIGEFFELFEKYSPLVTMCGRVTAKL